MTTTLKRSKPLLRSWEIMRIFCVIDLIFIIDVSICHTWMILLYRETPKNFPTNYTQKIQKLWGFVEAWASSLKKLSLRMPIFFTFVECGNPTKKRGQWFFSWQNWPYSCTKDTTYSIGTFSFTCIPLIILNKKPKRKQPLPPLEQKLHILN